MGRGIVRVAQHTLELLGSMWEPERAEPFSGTVESSFRLFIGPPPRVWRRD